MRYFPAYCFYHNFTQGIVFLFISIKTPCSQCLLSIPTHFFHFSDRALFITIMDGAIPREHLIITRKNQIVIFPDIDNGCLIVVILVPNIQIFILPMPFLSSYMVTTWSWCKYWQCPRNKQIRTPTACCISVIINNPHQDRVVWTRLSTLNIS